MSVEQLSVALREELAGSRLSYPEVAATRCASLPDGYRLLEDHILVPGGRRRFDRIATVLMSWGVQLGAGLRMQVSDPQVRENAVLIATLRLGPLAIRTRCRVVYVIDDRQRVGFAYGTLPGHPERGEERFLVELVDDDTVRFGLRAFSRNASALARLGGPISRQVQTAVNHRYLRAVSDL